MTSFTKALYRRDPAAAEAFYRQQQFEHKINYGKVATLAQFSPAHRGGSAQFGKRQVPPTLPAFECSNDYGFDPKVVVRAADSLQARQEYASYYGLAVSDVAARPMTSQS